MKKLSLLAILLATSAGAQTLWGGGHAPSNSPTFSGTVTLPDGSKWASGGLTNFSHLEFTGVSITGTGQDINDAKGQPYTQGGSTARSGAMWELSSGTPSTPSPVCTGTGPCGPLFSISEEKSLTAFGGANQCNSGIENPCVALVTFAIEGLTTDLSSSTTLNLRVTDKTDNAACGTCDGNLLKGDIISNPAGTNTAVKVGGGQFNITDGSSTSAATAGGVTGFAYKLYENSQDCPRNNGSAFGKCPGLFMASNGTFKITDAFEIDAQTAGFWDGIVAMVGCCVDTTYIDWSSSLIGYDNRGTHATETWNDQGSSPISLNIAGTHATAAINVVASAGTLTLNNNNITSSGSIVSGASVIANLGGFELNNVHASSTVPTILPNSNDTGSGMGAAAINKFSLIANSTDIADGQSSGLQLLGIPTAPTAAVDTNTTQLATTAYVIGQGYAKTSSFSGTVPITYTAGVIACPTCGVTGSPLSQFAATTSAQLAGVISDETGSGALVFGTSPTITSPTLSGTVAGAGTIPLTILATQSADTLLVNATGGAASPTAVAFPITGTNGCAGTGDALRYNTSTHVFSCNSAVNAAQLSGATFAAPGAIGGTTPAAGSFTGLTMTGAIAMGNNSITGLNNLTANAGAGYQLSGGTVSGTVPALSNRGDLTSGFGGASGHASLIGSSTLVLDVTSGGTFFKVITTGTAADDLCMVAGGLAEIQASTCTISSKRYKTMFGAFKGDALYALMHLTVWDFVLKEKNADPNGNRPTIGVTAEGVNQWASACSIYDTAKGKFVLKHGKKVAKSFKPECMIGMLIAGAQAQQKEIISLKAEVASLEKRK